MTCSACLRAPCSQIGSTRGLDIVYTMAIRTDGGDLDQTVSIKCFPMNALLIFLERPFGVDMMLDNNLHILMANSTRAGNVRAIYCRFRVFLLPNAMPSVTIRTSGHICHARLPCNSVHAIFVLIHG